MNLNLQYYVDQEAGQEAMALTFCFFFFLKNLVNLHPQF